VGTSSRGINLTTVGYQCDHLSVGENLSPAFRVLLACGRAAIRADDWSLHVDLPSKLPREFIDQARLHGLTAIAHRCFEVSGNYPHDVQKVLQKEAVASVVESLEQVRAFKAAAASFEKTGIPWLCVKGPVAAETLYDEPSLRPFSDIDILIHPSDFEAACASLMQSGYRPYFDMPLSWQELFFRQQSTLIVENAGSGNIDLQWELLPMKYSFSLAMNDLWARAELRNIYGIRVKTPGAHDTLVFLCLHAAKHEWERLIWLADIAALITRSDRLDWDALVNDLEHTSRKTPLHVSLMLVQSLFGVDLPTKISNRVNSDAKAVKLCKERIRRWQQEPPKSSPWPWKSLFYHSMSVAADRAQWWHDVLLRPTPLEWKAVRLPFSCRGAYYAIRPFRLMWKHSCRQFRRNPRIQPIPEDSR
jgi:Uncharacterised nucleotidyltransferase